MPRIVLTFNDKIVKEIPLTDAVINIGRKPDNDLVIDNLAVSSRHARGGRREDVLLSPSSDGMIGRDARPELPQFFLPRRAPHRAHSRRSHRIRMA